MNIINLKKYFNIKFLNSSFWLTLILAYVIPTKTYNIYGFPFKLFKIFPESHDNSLIFCSEFQILSFLTNVIIVFIALNLLNNLIYIIKKLLTSNKENIK